MYVTVDIWVQWILNKGTFTLHILGIGKQTLLIPVSLVVKLDHYSVCINETHGAIIVIPLQGSCSN